MTSPSVSDRNRAAIIYATEGFRWGLGPLKRQIADLVRFVETSDDPCVNSPKHYLLNNLLFAVGQMDTARSHTFLARLLRESPSHTVRSDALDGMAFEKKRFDVDLVLPFASEHRHRSEILSALYALEFRDCVRKRSEDVRERLIPLLRYDHPMVRAYAIGVLRGRAENFDLILPFRDDPSALVRESVEEPVRYWDM